MPTGVDAVEYDQTLPERSDVVVIGGGIAGVSTALALAEKGVSVTLCEKGRIAAEQSSRNWGWCRIMGRDPAEIPLAVESLRMWREMNAHTRSETGFRQTGTMWLCDSPRDLEPLSAWLEHARAWQLDTRLLDGNGVADALPGMQRRFAGGLHTASDGRAEPQKAVPAMAMAARRRGASILGACAVRGVETQAGAISGVVTERGRIASSSVVLAGGAWSRLFCGNLGLFLPQLKLLGSVLRTEPLNGPPECAVGGSNFAFRKRLDGGFTIARRNAAIADIVPDSFRLFSDFLPTLRTSWRELRLRIGRRFVEEWRIRRRWSLDEVTPFEQVRVLDPEPSGSLLAEGLENLRRAFPVFARARVTESWGGLIDATPDAVPVISPVAMLPGFFVATGFSGHGFGIGPAAGRLMADLVTGDRPLVDAAPYAFGRFRHGDVPISRSRDASTSN
jgi:glycine/D-amino acid oxidase-like deaminating enzyme